MNWRLLIVTGILLIFGLMVLYSATQTSSLSDSSSTIFYRQLMWTVIGICAFGIAMSTSTRFLSFSAPFFYLFSVLTLILVLVMPPNATGTHRWLSLGFMQFQPSELAKLAVIFMLANYFAHRTRPLESLREAILPGLIAGIPMTLVLVEPDLGTSLSFVPIFLIIVYWGGLTFFQILFIIFPVISLISIYSPWLWLIFLIVLLLLLLRLNADLIDNAIIFLTSAVIGLFGPYLWSILHDYQKQRIFTFFDPEKDPLGAGYQIIQSRVAIGSGGLWGKGFLAGTQKKLAFLPEQHTDFIFSVIGEELGLLGTFFFLALYGWILYKFVEIAQNLPNRFASYTVIGIVTMLATHVVINIGMTLGTFPVVGIPLPLVSYGGSSLVMTLFGIGVVFSIQRHQDHFF